ncbi:MAG: tyrosine--tRNA ligase [Planctomycetes bacterium]|jgi:tyrosyl-tRNA synthetase|nr:tyrosine--tRNA ligase [Planctomycetota bacterium]
MNLQEHLCVFRRGVVDLVNEEELVKKLERSGSDGLRIKFGLDPSSRDLHLGHAVVLRKLSSLQELGHRVILLVGEATAMVGDPSGRNKLRPQLTREEVKENLKTYTEQAAIVLDMERTEVRYNTEWFDKMSFGDVLNLTARMTVAQMIQRDTFQKRLGACEPIGIHEFLYPLMQGWDSVELKADVELGGTDQLFNLLVGRQLQEQVGQEPQIVITTPLINGTDGRKMSKSYGNAIGLTDLSDDMFGKTMSMPDEDMAEWFELLTSLESDEVTKILSGHPRAAKARLAQEVVSWLYGESVAVEARAEFDRRFVNRELPSDIPEHIYAADWPAEGVPLAVLLRDVGLVKSSSEARRLVGQGGVKVNGEAVREPMTAMSPPEDGLLLQVGKRRFVKVRLPQQQ